MSKSKKLSWSSPSVYHLKFGDTSGSSKGITGPAVEGDVAVHTYSSDIVRKVHDLAGGAVFHAKTSSGSSSPVNGNGYSAVKHTALYGPS